MNPSKISFTLAAGLLFASGMFTGCESTDGGDTRVTTNTYYGVGFYDPWYYGDYHDDHIVVVPPRRGDSPSPVPPPDQGLRPSQPIVRPPHASSRPPAVSQMPADRPMPSIPSAPRPAFRGGGRGR